MHGVFPKRDDDKGLNRQLCKPRIVYDPFFLGGGGEQEWCIEGVAVKNVRSGVVGSLRNLF